MATLIELCLSLAIVAILYAIAFGSELELNLSRVALVCGTAFFATFVAARWLSEKLVAGWMGGGLGRARGPAAEGLSRMRRGELETAEQLLRQCLNEHPGDAEAARGLAEIAFRRGHWEPYVAQASQLLLRPDALRRGERVSLCHRVADVCLERLGDRTRAIESLVRIELDYPGTTDAARARQRIERILSARPGAEEEGGA